MKKIVLGIAICFAFSVCNYAYGFSRGKAAAHSLHDDVFKNFSAGEFVKLSAKQLSDLTGYKMSAGDKVSFAILKMQMKHTLKKNPGLQLRDFLFHKKHSSIQRILLWIVLGFFFLILMFILIFGLAPR